MITKTGGLLASTIGKDPAMAIMSIPTVLSAANGDISVGSAVGDLAALPLGVKASDTTGAYIMGKIKKPNKAPMLLPTKFSSVPSFTKKLFTTNNGFTRSLAGMPAFMGVSAVGGLIGDKLMPHYL